MQCFFDKQKLNPSVLIKRHIVLVTGASSGLGLAIAKRLICDDKYFVILTSKAMSSFKFDDEKIFSCENVVLRNLDIIDHEQISWVIKDINENYGGVDILINNAGVTEMSSLEDADDLCRQRQLDVNYLAPMELISKVLPNMRKKRYGRIINVSSASGFMAMPTMSSYSASKFALEAASESLWYEVKPWGIYITLIIPGFIHSLGYLNVKESLNCKMTSSDSKSVYYEHYKGMRSLIEKNMNRSLSTNENIALNISKILNKANPPLRVYITLDAKFFYYIRKFLPSILYHYIFYKFLPNIRLWGKN